MTLATLLPPVALATVVGAIAFAVGLALGRRDRDDALAIAAELARHGGPVVAPEAGRRAGVPAGRQEAALAALDTHGLLVPSRGGTVRIARARDAQRTRAERRVGIGGLT